VEDLIGLENYDKIEPDTVEKRIRKKKPK